jgi:hypothetical protein
MSTDSADDTNNQTSPLINEAEIDKILTLGWEVAARKNPMLLAQKPGASLQKLREMVRDCLAKGISATIICEQVHRELLGSEAI